MLIWTDRLLFPCDEFYILISLPSSQEVFLLCFQIRTMLAGCCAIFLMIYYMILVAYLFPNFMTTDYLRLSFEAIHIYFPYKFS